MSIRLPSIAQILALHDDMITRCGGSSGLRSLDALAGAWGRAESHGHYVPEADLAERAAVLTVSIAKAHAFSDGNKRAAYGALCMTLSLNGFTLGSAVAETRDRIIGAASERDAHEALAAWLRENISPDPVYQALFNYDASPEP